MTETKACRLCEVEKPLTEFHAGSGKPGGHGWCKPCSSERRRARYLANQEKVAAQGRADYVSKRDERRARKRAYYEANAEKWNEYVRKRRARKYATDVGDVDLDELWTGRCPICCEDIDATLGPTDPMRKSVDHIVPLFRGGTHTQENLQWTHLRCNQRKGTSMPAQVTAA